MFMKTQHHVGQQDPGVVLAEPSEWWDFASGMWHFHEGACRFGILVTHHELDFQEVSGDVQQGVCQ